MRLQSIWADFNDWRRDPEPALGLLAWWGLPLLRRLPFEWVSECGALFGRYWRNSAAQSRAERNLKFLRPDWSAAEREACLNAMWQHAGRTFTEFAQLDQLWEQGRIEVVHPEAAERLGQAPRARLCLFVHLGNWNVTALACEKHGLSLRSVADVPKSRWVDRRVRQLRQRAGNDTLEPGHGGARELLRRLAAQQAVALAVDESIERQLALPLFGRSQRASGNLDLVLRAGQRFQAAMGIGYCLRLPGGRFRVVFHPITDGDDAWHAQPDADKIAQINALIEVPILDNLAQWNSLRLVELALPAAVQTQ